MSLPVLAAKLFIPPVREQAIRRPRLIDRLNAGLNRKLTLVQASAGYGKTTLISQWAACCGRPVAWLSLEPADRDLARFLTLLAAALQAFGAQIGAGAAQALHTPQPPDSEAVLTMLLNDLAAHACSGMLVLDDYQAVSEPQIDAALSFLLRHLPPELHLVVASRELPSLPLGRLRARGELTELLAADLRFTDAEAAAFLEQSMSAALAEAEVSALAARTEGWIAGLQLAALSLQGREGRAGLIEAFAGDHRYIADYLVEEVLQQQPEAIRSFLLQTSVLERLHGSLCDAVTGQEGGGALLEQLERGNFFVVPLDDTRSWYRYHHLFAEALAAHMSSAGPERTAELHRRASGWYAQQGGVAEAIRHALAAADMPRAAELLERAWPQLRRERQEREALGWLKALPEALFACRPVLSAQYAWALLACGEAEAALERLRDAERWLSPASGEPEQPDYPASARVVADETEFRLLPSTIAGYRAAYAQARGDAAAAMSYARQALAAAPEDCRLVRGAASALLGLACWTSGELEAAYEAFAGGMADVERAGNLSDAVGGTLALADIRIVQGRLHQAQRLYERGLRLAGEAGRPDLRGTVDLLVGLSGICCERNDLPAARAYLERSREQGEPTGFPQHPYRWRVAAARIREAEGDWAAASELLGEAERLYVGDFFPDVRPVAGLRLRLLIRQDRWLEALEQLRERGLAADGELSYLREFEHVTQVRALLAQYRSERQQSVLSAALTLLERLLRAAEAGGRTGSVIEMRLLQAVGRYLQGDAAGALPPMEHALKLAEPEGYVRLFADEGRAMAELLEAAAKRGGARAYVRRLLAACRPEAAARPEAGGEFAPLLSEREREVLRLLGSDLSGPAIACELHISLNTLRTHTKHIYDKLEVNSRRAAVRRAKELIWL
ncbi:helix-turn-helix transcriptional regulator [Paenibacillus athensensis]|uniref:Helix-turn-helix transcriptional regulator n=1 Tax=Paenibacillus athensensis TaxID=1967502 RepID=A0A4Y8Q8L3_9BACL|nr:LuxR C-terminal-related transcriptional regulator [Paenibacillus athensensis]MCD1260008.1 helix-turn-helix transcriptional regulator [Paenibacillus athensensis]